MLVLKTKSKSDTEAPSAQPSFSMLEKLLETAISQLPLTQHVLLELSHENNMFLNRSELMRLIK